MLTRNIFAILMLTTALLLSPAAQATHDEDGFDCDGGQASAENVFDYEVYLVQECWEEYPEDNYASEQCFRTAHVEERDRDFLTGPEVCNEYSDDDTRICIYAADQWPDCDQLYQAIEDFREEVDPIVEDLWGVIVYVYGTATSLARECDEPGAEVCYDIAPGPRDDPWRNCDGVGRGSQDGYAPVLLTCNEGTYEEETDEDGVYRQSNEDCTTVRAGSAPGGGDPDAEICTTWTRLSHEDYGSAEESCLTARQGSGFGVYSCEYSSTRKSGALEYECEATGYGNGQGTPDGFVSCTLYDNRGNYENTCYGTTHGEWLYCEEPQGDPQPGPCVSVGGAEIGDCD